MMGLVLSHPIHSLCTNEKPLTSLLKIGGGYLCDKKCAGGIIQVEYKSTYRFLRYLRPQGTLVLSQHGLGYIGMGMAWECYLADRVLLIPSFEPGIYWKGNGFGKKLGCLFEFRSALELAYEMRNQIRVGIEIFHVSNAHLSHRNPGFNAIALNVSIPLKLLE